jgi:peptidoglycan/LPS O-acetylase OafA/YrhL
VLLVLGRHATWPDVGSSLRDVLMRGWIRGGWVGVDLFFVLSGFLVSGLLFREYRKTGRIWLSRFLIRRGLKIYPSFYVLLFVYVVQTVARKGFGAINPAAVLSEALFVQNYGASVFQHSWSLAVEEHFYALCAVTIYLLTRRSKGVDPFRTLPWLFAGLAIGCLSLRIITSALLPYSHSTHLFPTHLRLDSLGFGVLLAYVHHFHPGAIQAVVRGRERLVVGAGVLMLAPPFFFPVENALIHTVGLTLFYLGAGLLAVGFLISDLRPNVVVRALSLCGRHSYSIYLWHINVKTAIERLAARHPSIDPGIVFVAYLLGSVAVGIVIGKLIEVPVLRVRDRLFPATHAA